MLNDTNPPLQWPERAYCSEDGKESFFTCDYFKDLGIRPLQRRVKNEDQVGAAPSFAIVMFGLF